MTYEALVAKYPPKIVGDVIECNVAALDRWPEAGAMFRALRDKGLTPDEINAGRGAALIRLQG